MSSPSKPVVRGQKRVARTRRAILDAAEQLFAEHDPEGIRIEDIAALANVSPASVYVHFQTKDGVLAATIDRLLELGTETLESAFTTPAEPFDRFVGIGAAYLGLLLEHPAIVRYLALTGNRAPSSEADIAVDRRLAALRDRFQAEIESIITAGGIRPVDARGLSYFLMGAWHGVAALALRKDGLALDRAGIEHAVTEAGMSLARGLRAEHSA